MHVAAVEKVRVCDDLSAAFTLRDLSQPCRWCPAHFVPDWQMLHNRIASTSIIVS